MAESNWNDFQQIYIDRESLKSQVAKRALEIFTQVTIVDEEPYANLKGELSAQQFSKSKRELFITPFAGSFFKRCPGSRPGLTCCNYFVLNLGQQCNMNCSYCYLQSFINSPVMKVYSNIDKALAELSKMGETLSKQRLRVGTGEIIDSLSLDPLTLYSRELIYFFKKYPNWTLEFKTKSSQVDQFLTAPHAGNIVVSFSINPQIIVDKEEHSTASLHQRLLAARKARDHGFQVAFHIDPVIYHENWEHSYLELINQVTELFTSNEISTMSIGGLRFQPEQRHMMRERFGMKSLVTAAEVFSGKDGKLRYDQSRRSQMFKFILDEFKSRGYQKIFLCMETPETWLDTVGSMPKQNGLLDELFDHNLLRQVRSYKANH